jgi:hypothetical protein
MALNDPEVPIEFDIVQSANNDSEYTRKLEALVESLEQQLVQKKLDRANDLQ